MDEYETKAKYNIAETCCASISIEELAGLSENKEVQASKIIDLSAVQNYGEIRGSTALRNNLSALYSSKAGSPLSPDNVLITPGAIAANHLVFYALLKEGDHVVCHYPTYQQLYSVPESLGAKVDLWKSREDNKWLPDFEELKSLVRENTKLIVLKFVTHDCAGITIITFARLAYTSIVILRTRPVLSFQRACWNKSSNSRRTKGSPSYQTKCTGHFSMASHLWIQTFHPRSSTWVTKTPS